MQTASFDFDLFISYSRHDNSNGTVSELVAFIQREYRRFTGNEALRVFFDKGEVTGTQDWKRRTYDGLGSSCLLLVCLSPSYLETRDCAWEFSEYLGHLTSRVTAGTPVDPIFFVELADNDDPRFEQKAAEWISERRVRQHFEFQPWFDEGAAALKEAVVRALLQKGELTANELGAGHQGATAKGNLDPRNHYFVGRSSELRRLREIVTFERTGRITAISGPEGIGKTTLAIEYGHAFAHEYPGGSWEVRCSGLEDLRAALADLAGVRDLEFDSTEEEKRNVDLGFERVLGELKQRADCSQPSRVLVILDDIDQPSLLAPQQLQRLPQADWLHIIATTPLDEYELLDSNKDCALLSLNELSEEESLKLIERYQPNQTFLDGTTRDVGRDIVRKLGTLPLTVERSAISFAQFPGAQSCAAFRDQLMSEEVIGYEERLSLALRPTLELLDGVERAALIYAALMPADHVALPWIRTLLGQSFPQFKEEAAPDGSGSRAMLQRLFRLRLLQATTDDREARMHRSVQETVKRVFGAASTNCEEALLVFVKTRAEFLWENWVNRLHRWELVPLVAFTWDYLRRGASEGAYLANQAFGPLRSLGSFAEAESLIRRALAIEERSVGLSHPNVATCLNNLAALLSDTGRLEEARTLYCRALAIDEQSFGQRDPRVATCLNNLAQSLKATNRLEEAEALYRRALAIDEQSLGTNHSRAAIHLNNLAQLLQRTDRLDEAEQLYRRAVAIDEKVLGSTHPRVAIHLNNLAQLLQMTNRPGEAESLYRRALAIDEESLGPSHPRVATHLNNLAFLVKIRDPQEAEILYRRALAIDAQSFGWSHPNVAADLNNLAVLLETTDRLEEAD